MNDEVSQSPFDLAPPTNVITVQIVDSDAEALRNCITQVLFGQSVADLRRLAGVLRVSNYKTLNKTGLVRSLVGGHDHHHLMQFLLDKGFANQAEFEGGLQPHYNLLKVLSSNF